MVVTGVLQGYYRSATVVCSVVVFQGYYSGVTKVCICCDSGVIEVNDKLHTFANFFHTFFILCILLFTYSY